MYQTQKLLRDQESFTGAERDQVEAALKDLEGALEGGDLDPIRQATERLTTASHAFSSRLYEQATQQAPSATAAADDEVVDAEIVEEESSS